MHLEVECNDFKIPIEKILLDNSQNG